MMLITTADVFGRYLFASPLPGAFEITQILLAATIFAGLPIVTLKQEHVTVTIASDRLPASLRRVHAALASLVGALILATVAWRLAGQAARLASYGDTTSLLRIPLSPLAWMMAGLTALAAVFAALLAWRALAGAPAPAAILPPQAS
jgi:TRAP-type C4-dicarboxylate transport system permease small subunit